VKQTIDTVLSDLGRTAKGALFLRRLLYWWPKAVVVHDGEFWLYRHGREEWADEINTSLRVFKRIITTLQADGLIETRTFQLVNKAGKPFGPKVQHVRPTEHLLNLIKDRTGQDMKGPTLAPKADQVEPPQHPGMPKSMGMLTAAELMKIWTALHIELYPKTYAAGFTSADKGIFGQLARAWPAGYAGNVLKCVVTHWDYFAKDKAKAQGAFPIPGEPQLRFLNKWSQIAVSYWMQKEGLIQTADGSIRPEPKIEHKLLSASPQTAPAPKPVAPGPGTPLPAKVEPFMPDAEISAEPEPDEPKMTLEELWADPDLDE
jgi:hypothetical protein